MAVVTSADDFAARQPGVFFKMADQGFSDMASAEILAHEKGQDLGPAFAHFQQPHTGGVFFLTGEKTNQRRIMGQIAKQGPIGWKRHGFSLLRPLF
jgi:hypothetical protein